MVRGLNGRLFAIVLLACLAAACDDNTPTIPTNPVLPKTETFTGEVTPERLARRTTSTSGAGAIIATLKAIGSDNTLVVSFALGTWTGAACSIVLANDAATGGAILTGTMTGPGTLCARVGDRQHRGRCRPAYTIEVTHP